MIELRIKLIGVRGCRQIAKREHAAGGGDLHATDAASKGQRAVVFADFLLQTFGRSSCYCLIAVLGY